MCTAPVTAELYYTHRRSIDLSTPLTSSVAGLCTMRPFILRKYTKKSRVRAKKKLTECAWATEGRKHVPSCGGFALYSWLPPGSQARDRQLFCQHDGALGPMVVSRLVTVSWSDRVVEPQQPRHTRGQPVPYCSNLHYLTIGLQSRS